MATSSEACTLTPRKCFAEEGKNFRKWLENELIWLHFFALAYRILASEVIYFFISEKIFGGYFQ